MDKIITDLGQREEVSAMKVSVRVVFVGMSVRAACHGGHRGMVSFWVDVSRHADGIADQDGNR